MDPTKSYGSDWAGFRLVHAGNEKRLMKRSIGCRINLQEAHFISLAFSILHSPSASRIRI